MRNKVKYEWSYEIVDEHNDIVESEFEYKISDFAEHEGNLVLVRDEIEPVDGDIVERSWAYVKDGRLPEFFEDTTDEPTDIRVPKRFHDELEKFMGSKK